MEMQGGKYIQADRFQVSISQAFWILLALVLWKISSVL